MNDLILDRMNAQIRANFPIEKPTEIQREVQIEIEHPKKTPLTINELETILMNEVEPTTQQVIDPKVKNFSGVQDFAPWYQENREKFSDMHRIPLDSLVQARDMIDMGCGCKRQYRLNQANEYFKTFWLNNQQTPLPKKLLEVGGFTSISFGGESNPFMIVSADTQ